MSMALSTPQAVTSFVLLPTFKCRRKITFLADRETDAETKLQHLKTYTTVIFKTKHIRLPEPACGSTQQSIDSIIFRLQ